MKTKHSAVLVRPVIDRQICNKVVAKRKKVSLYDLRQCSIDKLRWWLGTFDWTPVIACDSVTTMYSQFLQTVCDSIAVCIPVKTVTIGPRDPDFVTPLVKSLLVKRRKLRKQGRKEAADELAGKINNLISEFRKNRLAHLSDASPKELWNVVRSKSNSRPIDDNVYLRNPDIVNNYFAGIATDNGYIKSDVLNFRRIDGTQDCGVWNFSDYEVESYLRKIRNTPSGYNDLPCWLLKQC